VERLYRKQDRTSFLLVGLLVNYIQSLASYVLLFSAHFGLFYTSHITCLSPVISLFTSTHVLIPHRHATLSCPHIHHYSGILCSALYLVILLISVSSMPLLSHATSDCPPGTFTLIHSTCLCSWHTYATSRCRDSFLSILLLLSGNIELNPGYTNFTVCTINIRSALHPHRPSPSRSFLSD